ncbi:MAG TPA: TetR-like C-terminal domain-containing protein [Micromonosporaceae bacterium]|jgi:AcrR family transcriptional regulator
MSMTSSRDRYHHGDLANALATAALDLAREGGPEAVVLRAAARQVGVSPTAAYRHFAGHDALMATVKEHCQLELVGRMHAELAATAPEPDPDREALRRLRALGLGYIQFARSEPGLFRTAFGNPGLASDMQWEHMLEAPAFRELNNLLDELCALGVLDDEHRRGAELVAWSAVHGLSMLILDGPLGALPPADLEHVIDRVLDGVHTAVLGREIR